MQRDGPRPFARPGRERAFNEALDRETEEFPLAASSPSGEKIHRNGHRDRTLKTSFGPLSLRVSRNRLALFKTEMIKPCQRMTDGFEYPVHALYPQGLATSETIERLMDRSPTDLSRESMGKPAAELAKKADELRSLALPECLVVFIYVPSKGTTARPRP